MKQLLLIIEREYITRVRRRSFILTTLLTPLAIGLFIAVVQLIFRYQSDDALSVAVIDPGKLFNNAIADDNTVYFSLTDQPLDSLTSQAAAQGDDFPYDGILLVPPAGPINQKAYEVHYYSDQKLTLDAEPILANRIQTALRQHKIRQLNLKEEEIEALETELTISPHSIRGDQSAGSSLTGTIAAMIGAIMGLIMYTTVFVYGMMVMRGVMEEKTNRIVEVMVSSVRPFPLMMGKIIGVGGVGLTQVAVWAVLIPGILLLVNLFFGINPQGAVADTTEWNPADA